MATEREKWKTGEMMDSSSTPARRGSGESQYSKEIIILVGKRTGRMFFCETRERGEIRAVPTPLQVRWQGTISIPLLSSVLGPSGLGIRVKALSVTAGQETVNLFSF